MRLAVIGATGRTGRHVVEQALSGGHQVTALARHPAALTRADVNLFPVEADVRDLARITQALAGASAVVSTVGIGAARGPTAVYSAGIANILHAMRAHGIGRLAVISAAPAGPRTEQPFLQRRFAMPALELFFGASYRDMRRMEALLSDSDVDWIALRPPRLVGKAATGRYRVDAARPLPRSRSVTYADLATALLDALDDPGLYRRAACVAN